MIERNLFLIKEKVNQTCKIYNKDSAKINIIAVSKTILPEKIYEAINFGCKMFGENYIKEAKEKWSLIRQSNPEIELHFIGHLQSNKAKEAVALFDCIQTLDSEKLALAIAKEVKKQHKNPKIFIQVNIGEEPQKSGIELNEVNNFIKLCRDLNLNLVGLMCIPPANEHPANYFALLKKIANENNLLELSMGMSADFEEAIALGSTYIRLGTAIFGERK